jgi:hypothetical protein
MENEGYRQEVMWAWGAALVGLELAILFWAGRHPMNFAMTWVPQLIVLVVMLLLGARPAAIGGAAIAFAAYLSFFKWWVQNYYPLDGLVWLLYLCSLPGGLIAGIAAAVRFDRDDTRPAIKAGLVAAGMVIGGITVNQLSLQAVV